MHIRKRPLLLALPLAAAGLGIGVVPTLAAHAAHARPATVSHAVPMSMSMPMSKPMPRSAAATRAAHARLATVSSTAAPVDHVTIYVFRKKSLLPGAPGGAYHDEMVPSTWAVRVGVWTEVTMINYDDGPHSLTIPQLGLDEIAQGGTKITTPFAGETQWETLNLAVPTVTTFVFRVSAAGLYAWHCEIPCDGGVAGVSYAMTPANDFGMTGFIVAA
jgi:FtsP/CotA-like multicopper oxidase with cupredoxin domain